MNTLRSRILVSALAATVAGAGCDGTQDPTGPTGPVPVAAVLVTAPTAPFESLGESVQLVAQARDASGNPVQAQIAWTSADATIVSVDATGVATAVGNGSTVVTASAGNASGQASVVVSQRSVALAFSKLPAEATVGQPLDPLEVVFLDARQNIALNANDPVSISPAGVQNGVQVLNGTTTVAAVDGFASFFDVTVEVAATGLRLVATAGDIAETSAPFDSRPLQAPFDNFAAADLVFGQPNFTSGDRHGGTGSVNPSGICHRGTVTAADGLFYVSDSCNSRVLGFRTPPGVNGASADFVLGQTDLFTAVAPGDIVLTDSTFVFPSRVLAAEGKLLVSDHNNNRILIWNQLPNRSNEAADVVVGQPDFSSSGSGVSRTAMFAPFFFTVAGGRLIVTDALNHRVLIWNSIPTANGAPADLVLGQPDFTSRERGTTASRMSGPSGVWSDGTRLVLADLSNRRVLVWTSFPTLNDQPADLVVGAPDFVTRGTGEASATTIGGPESVTSDGRFLYVTDTTHDRVLIFPFPTQNGGGAVGVLGQSDFSLSAGDDPNQDGVSEGAVSARTLSDSRGAGDITFIGSQLFVSDPGNHRILRFSPVR